MIRFFNKNKKNDLMYILTIPIKVDNYDGLFNEFHNTELSNRKINDSLDQFLKSMLFASNNTKKTSVELVITLPKEVKSAEKEQLSTQGILTNYTSFSLYEKKVKIMGFKRIIYYLLISLVLLSAWFFITTNNGNSILTALLNAGGTVVLWQAMTLVLIENKNLKANVIINNNLAQMKIIFNYI